MYVGLVITPRTPGNVSSWLQVLIFVVVACNVLTKFAIAKLTQSVIKREHVRVMLDSLL